MVHILVVDDDKNTRLLFSAVLESAGYMVTSAENGKAALEVMDREHIDLPEVMVQANEELLKQVWINLADNAIKFSPDGADVSFEVVELGESVAVKISNFGPDIPPEKLKKIFNKFYQADESHSREGNGIGLVIVRKVVDLHNGRIDVTCENGKTTFVVTLPVKQRALFEK